MACRSRIAQSSRDAFGDAGRVPITLSSRKLGNLVRTQTENVAQNRLGVLPEIWRGARHCDWPLAGSAAETLSRCRPTASARAAVLRRGRPLRIVPCVLPVEHRRGGNTALRSKDADVSALCPDIHARNAFLAGDDVQCQSAHAIAGAASARTRASSCSLRC